MARAPRRVGIERIWQRAPKRVGIERIRPQAALQVSFSKRRQGLFKKAVELSILCGTESAILIQSPGGKIYALGEPDVHAVIRRFLRGAPAGEATHEEEFTRRIMNQELFGCLQSCELWLETGDAKVHQLAARETAEVDQLGPLAKAIANVEQELSRRAKDALQEPPSPHLPGPIPPLHPAPLQQATRENPATQPYTGALEEALGPHLPGPIPPLYSAPHQQATLENPATQPYTGALPETLGSQLPGPIPLYSAPQPATSENSATQPYTGAPQETLGPHLLEPIAPLHPIPRRPAPWEHPARQLYTGAPRGGLNVGVRIPGFTPSGAFSLAGGGSSSGYAVQEMMRVDPVRRLHGLEDFSQGYYVGGGWSGFGGQSASSAAVGQNLAGFGQQELGVLLPISFVGQFPMLPQPAGGYDYSYPIWHGESSSSAFSRIIEGEGDQRIPLYAAPLPPAPPLPPHGGWIPLPQPLEDEDDDGPLPHL